MRTIGWLMLTLAFLAASVLLVAWPDLKELMHARIWNVSRSDDNETNLNGVRIFIDEGRAMILPAMDDRALIYLRLGLQGEPSVLESWMACDIGLTDGNGHTWRPLINQAGLEIIDMLGADSDVDDNCDQSLLFATSADAPSLSVQAFLVPVGALNDLRLQFAAMTTRPDAVSIPFRPVLRPPA
ncbi:MAG: hypothetical protein DI616_08550 [Paracoccus denitrificans]|uniref:Uncharacterized protein n=1 Tax=Paracoccus denitrificans TaxID=266 RepID=A0A533I664_PARDE|nr:MAG: hypothetical protein DI616_08550 [Paracoccus denitrificans]